MASKKLIPPKNLHIDFKPSPKQYELWKLLQPECPICGGEIEQKLIGYDANHNPKYKPHCIKCGNSNIHSSFWVVVPLVNDSSASLCSNA